MRSAKTLKQQKWKRKLPEVRKNKKGMARLKQRAERADAEKEKLKEKKR